MISIYIHVLMINFLTMRKLLILIAAGIFLTMQACTSQPEKDKAKDNNVSKMDNKQIADKTPDMNTVNANNAINAPVHLTKADFMEKVMDYEKNPNEWVFKGELPCLIDFYADWCAPCRQTAPILDELAREYSGKIVIYKIDIQKEKELASLFGIQSIPAFLFCPVKGNPSMSAGIASSREETKKMFIRQIEGFLLNTNSGSTSL
jgi:thioredoxin